MNLGDCQKQIQTIVEEYLLKKIAKLQEEAKRYGERPDLLAECETQRKAIEGAYYDVCEHDDIEIIDQIKRELL
jgi:hypothetical protein